MWSDWIRALRDKELLYKKGLLLVDQLESAAKGGFETAWKKVIQIQNFVFWALVVAVGTTLIACGFWTLFRIIGIEASGYYQVLVIPVGLVWSFFLVCIAILLGVFEGLIKQFPRLEKPLADVKEGILRWLKLPAWVAFVALFLAVLVGRFPDLCRPQSILSLLGIISVFGLASFLGLCSVNVTWLKRFVQVQLWIALVLLLLAPQFPSVTAWLERRTSEGSVAIGLKANPKRVVIDPDSPPEFFVVGKPRFYFSHRGNNEFVLWDAKGFDPDTNEKLKPVDSKERREEILASLRAESALKKQLQEAEVAQKLQQEHNEIAAAAKRAEAQAPETAREVAEQSRREAEQRRAQKQARYFAQIPELRAGVEPRVVVVAASQRESDSKLSEAASSLVGRSGFVVATGLLRPEFVSDGLFENAFDGRWDSLSDLKLSERCEFLALCKFVATSENRPAFQNAKAASGKLTLKLVNSATGSKVFEQAYEASAAAFDAEKAIGLVREKMFALLATNTVPRISANK